SMDFLFILRGTAGMAILFLAVIKTVVHTLLGFPEYPGADWCYSLVGAAWGLWISWYLQKNQKKADV
ncbi:hypothetical protein IAI38_11795, partial [Streptococcus pseudopneumoniae]|uniref:hypothetical protein n=1 Tax=Streptococcus pseudopneumoniae TaxID=257758 RepID=UPI0018B0B50C